MDLMNSILSQVSGNATVQGLAAKVGLTPEEVQQAIAALAQAHSAGTASKHETVNAAADKTGLPDDKLHEVLNEVGGHGALSQLSAMLPEGAGGLMGGLSKFL